MHIGRNRSLGKTPSQDGGRDGPECDDAQRPRMDVLSNASMERAMLEEMSVEKNDGEFVARMRIDGTLVEISNSSSMAVKSMCLQIAIARWSGYTSYRTVTQRIDDAFGTWGEPG